MGASRCPVRTAFRQQGLQLLAGNIIVHAVAHNASRHCACRCHDDDRTAAVTGGLAAAVLAVGVVAADAEPLTVSVPAEGPLMLMEDSVEEDQLIPRLRELAETRATAKIFLRADGAIPYSRVVQVMGALNAAGFNNIVLVTDTGGPRMDG